jgi:Cys-tRNA(Pro)/Cys-tRNA(Cys) deacylase
MSNDTPAGALTRTRAEAIAGYLEGAGVPFEMIEHEPVGSAVAEAHAVERSPEKVAKTIVLHDGRAYVVVAISGADRLDLHKLRELLGASRQLRLAGEDEIARDFPALEVGAVPPFGPMLPAAEVIDRALAEQPEIMCPAGDHRHSVLVDPRDVVRVTDAKVADICEE